MKLAHQRIDLFERDVLQDGKHDNLIKGAVRELEAIFELELPGLDIRGEPAGRGVIVEPDAQLDQGLDGAQQ